MSLPGVQESRHRGPEETRQQRAREPNTHATLCQPRKLDDVRCEHGALVALDDVGFVLDEPEAVGVEDDVQVVLARERDGNLGRLLHVRVAAESAGNDG